MAVATCFSTLSCLGIASLYNFPLPAPALLWLRVGFIYIGFSAVLYNCCRTGELPPLRVREAAHPLGASIGSVQGQAQYCGTAAAPSGLVEMICQLHPLYPFYFVVKKEGSGHRRRGSEPC